LSVKKEAKLSAREMPGVEEGKGEEDLCGLGSSVSSVESWAKPRPKSIFVSLISQKASTRGLTTYDGKNSEEAHFRACLWALKSEET